MKISSSHEKHINFEIHLRSEDTQFKCSRISFEIVLPFSNGWILTCSSLKVILGSDDYEIPQVHYT